jgi:uncharacterized protein (TIGR03437 family)
MTSGTQINAQAPSTLAVNTEVQVTVQQGDAISVPQPVVIAAAAPGIFTQDGSGTGAGLIADAVTASLNSVDAPAHSGDSIVIYCTGLGVPAQSVTVSIGGIVADHVSAGPSATMPGAYEIVATVPDGIEPGDAVPVKITVAGQTSPAVTMLLR